ncbi:MAG: acetyl-CoA carboxylase biotin carboxyl carrier protein subunit [bacterium]|nr:acetyl-CoA carboxylase biotin carboxyl carrier protein subunit [bacterium]
MKAENGRRRMDGFSHFHVGGTDYQTRLTAKFSKRRAYRRRDPGQIRAIIPGSVLVVSVKPGQQVKSGQGLIVLEAMKMENEIAAPHAGRIRTVHAVVGQKVAKGDLLMELEPAPPAKPT